METVAGPHALLTLAESLIHSRRNTTKSFYSKHNIIAQAHIKFYFYVGEAQNWTGKSEHQEI